MPHVPTPLLAFVTLFLAQQACCPCRDWPTRTLSGWGEDAPPTDDSGGNGDTNVPGETGDTSVPVDTRVVTAPDWLNLRAEASGTSAVLRALPCGAVVTVQGEADGHWLPVTGEGVDGWAKDTWLALPDEVSDDLCPGPAAWVGEPPGSLVSTLDIPPYVEQSCADTTWDGWPFDAQRCTYNGGLRVTVADPSPELVAYWIADAAQMIPALAALEDRDRAAWKRGLEVIATATLYQSSRIFPLEGDIDEGHVYEFDRGVTVGCSTGCYCRINSLTRQQWCDYADAVLGIVDERDCLSEYSTSTWTDAWAEHCLDNHRAAWTGIHHHYRAMAYWANETIAGAVGDPESADPDDVVRMVEAMY
ncbi:MAG: SH3 domain-containing protein [Pseudomonadota bacterium]